jgi:diacylglycerol kinase family enzyme
MAGIGIITNPHSKLNRRNPRRQELLGYVAGERGHVEITNTLDDLVRAAAEFRRREVEILAINGGDGTISRTLTAFIRAYEGTTLPKIALLRGGTINMLASNLGISGSPEKILFRLMEAHSRGNYKEIIGINALRVEDEYGFLFANGSCCTFLEEFYRNKTGAIGSGLLLAKIIFSRFFDREFYDQLIVEDEMTVTPDERQAFKHRSCTFIAATVSKMPLGPKLFPENDEHSQSFQCVSAIVPSADAWYRMPPSILFRPNTEDGCKMRINCKRLLISCEKSNTYTLDGELFYPKKDVVELEIGPKLQFIVV